MTGEEGKALRLVGQQHRTEVAVAQTDLAVLGDGASMQKDCRPTPIILAASAADFTPDLMAMAAPTVYAQQAFSKQMGWMP